MQRMFEPLGDSTEWPEKSLFGPLRGSKIAYSKHNCCFLYAQERVVERFRTKRLVVIEELAANEESLGVRVALT